MDALDALKALASIATIVAAILVASNYSPKAMVAGFAIFICASLAWIASGWLESETSLLTQNIVLLIINIVGVIRWLPRADKDSASA